MTDPSRSHPDDRIGAIVEDVLERRRAGEPIDVDQLIGAHPQFEDDLRALVPTLEALEGRPTSGGDVLPGFEQLGPYKLLREIGRGGMGIVFEAEEERLGRRVALKVLPPQFQLSPTFIERFRVEAKAAAALNHDHIVPVHGVGEDRGMHFFVLRYIDGAPLNQIIERVKQWRSSTADDSAGEPTIADVADKGAAAREPNESSTDSPGGGSKRHVYFRSAARLITDVADAIAHAHAFGVVHRDLKPSNLIVDRSGKVWVSDFGLAKIEGGAELTQTGEMVGTLRYLPPNRLDGGGDSSDDIYAMGLILYELLTLRPAFDATERSALLKQVSDGRARRPRRIDPAIPPDLETIVLKAMSPLPSARYQTAAAMGDDLRAFLAARPIAARPPSATYLLRLAVQRNRAGAVAALLAGLVIVAAIAAYVVALKRSVGISDAARHTAERERDEARFRSYAADISASQIALERGDSGVARDHLERAPPEYRDWEWRYLAHALDQSVRTWVIETRRESGWGFPRRVHVRYHPDGKRILAIAGHEVRVIDTESGALLARARNRGRLEWSKFHWGPEGRWFAVNSRDEQQVQVWSVEPLECIRRFPARVRSVAVSPDGRTIATGLLGQVTLLDAETGDERRRWFLGDGVNLGLAFSPDGKTLYAPVGTVLHCLGLADNSHRELQVGSELRLTYIAVSRDGGQAALNTNFGTVIVIDLPTGATRHVLPATGTDPEFSTDGTQLATGSSVGARIWYLGLERVPKPRLLHGHSHKVGSVSFSPDGRRLATVAHDFAVKLWDLERLPPHRRTAHLGVVRRVAWHPDSRRIATWGDDRAVRLWDAATLTQLAAHPAALSVGKALAFTPDGESLVTRSDDGRALAIREPMSFALERTLATPLDTRAAADLFFSPTGDTLAVIGGKRHVSLHEWPNGQLRWSVSINPKNTNGPQFRFSNNGRWIAASVAQTVYLIDVRTGAIERLGEHGDRVCGLAFVGTSRRLATIGYDRLLKIWDIPTRRLLAQRETPSGFLMTIDATADGKRIVTASRKGRITLWDTDRFQRVFSKPMFAKWGYANCSPDGERIAVWNRSGQLFILDATDPKGRLDEPVPTPTDEPFLRDAIVADAWRSAVTPGLEPLVYRTAGSRLAALYWHEGHAVKMAIREALRYRLDRHRDESPSAPSPRECPLACDDSKIEQTRLAFVAMTRAAWKQSDLARERLGWLNDHIAKHGPRIPPALIAEVNALVAGRDAAPVPSSDRTR